MSRKIGTLIPNFTPFVPKESIDRVVETLKTPWIGGDGPRVEEFESEIAKVIKKCSGCK